ncbi:alpha/beta hydrolase [Vreelandella populi]|uniref:Alpha/beta hydrolase n=1 Tax=Vreelandella populi TaxID=2498858 RepID=A0A433LBI0_9GAMM|nr:alpha/beta hydrolase [Halomonas populi]RUR42342.1 alpha/beta hydrolase [Halomonas populi]RUR46052.1 alpha/beta hydrolase [Halomonas populi]
MLYRHFATQEEIDRAYNPMLGRDPQVLVKDWQQRSEASRARHRVTLDLAYGPSTAERMDIFHAQSSDAPVHVFYHGGYWRSLSHREFSFIVDGLVKAGITVAVVNYALCPQVRFSELVRQSQAAVAYVYRHAKALGVDPEQLSISGHSAGGHLSAMLVSTDWEGSFGLPNQLIRGALCISGLYDLRPFPWSWLQPKLQLSGRDVQEFSPLWLPCRVTAPMQLAVGGQEPEEFERQMTTYGEQLQQNGQQVEQHLFKEADHFSILEHYLEGGCFVEWIKAFHKV